MSGDPEQAYFADGIAEDIITDLSKLSGLLVISRNSSFAYRGDNIDVKKASRDLGAKYLLEGSVRRSGDRVRINVQLIEADAGAHLWAERYDGSLDDVFALQDSVTRKIIEAMKVTLEPRERQALAKSETTNAEAYDLVLRGVRALNAVDEFHSEENLRARESFEGAIRLDANFARAYAGLAWNHWNDFVYFNHFGSDRERALQLAHKSIELADNALARRLLAQSYLQLRGQVGGGRQIAAREYDRASSEKRGAVELEPSNADAIAELAYALALAGETDEAAGLMARARRLNPNFPNWYHQPAGIIHYLEGEYDLAVRETASWYEKSKSVKSFAPAPLWLAASLARAGRVQQAKAIVETLGMPAAATASRGPNLLAIRLATPLKRAEHLDRFIEGLRRAGVPEEPE